MNNYCFMKKCLCIRNCTNFKYDHIETWENQLAMVEFFERYILMNLVQISVLLGRKILRKKADSFSSKIISVLMKELVLLLKNPCFFTTSSLRINLCFSCFGSQNTIRGTLLQQKKMKRRKQKDNSFLLQHILFLLKHLWKWECVCAWSIKLQSWWLHALRTCPKTCSLCSSSDGKMESVCLCWFSCRETVLSHSLLQEISDCDLTPASGITGVPKTGCRNSGLELKLMFGRVTDVSPHLSASHPPSFSFIHTHTRMCTHTHIFYFSYEILSSGKRVGSCSRLLFNNLVVVQSCSKICEYFFTFYKQQLWLKLYSEVILGW